MHAPAARRGGRSCHRGHPRHLIWNLRTADHAPGAPEASLARTRNHMRVTGSVLVEYVEVVTVGLAIGEGKVSWSSIWMV